MSSEVTTFIRTLTGWLWAVSVLLLTGTAQAQQIDEPEIKLESVAQEIKSKEALRLDKEQKRTLLRNEIDNLKGEIDKLKQEGVKLVNDLEAAEEALSANLALTGIDLEARSKSAQKLIWGVITSEQLKQRNPVAMLILQSDPLKVDRLYNYHKYFASYLDQQIEERTEFVELRETERTLISREQAKAREARRLLDRNTETLDSRIQRLGYIETQLAVEVNSLNESLRLLLAEQQALTKLIADKTVSNPNTTTLPTPQNWSNKLRWPVSGEILQDYGQWRADGRIQTEGVIIGSAQQAAVRAVANGTVVFSQWLDGYKNTLIVAHGEDLISVYAYLDELVKGVDEPVESGEIIAKVGLADHLNQPGLYFEIRVRNQAMNPLDWLGN